jgi:DNA-binding transcriptional MocR family regulator
LSEKVGKMGLKISNSSVFNINSIRLGFASTNEIEIERGIEILKKAIK